MLIQYLMNMPPWKNPRIAGPPFADYLADLDTPGYLANATLVDVSYSLIVGDLEPDMELACTVNGVAEPLTGALAHVMQWLKPDGTFVTVSLTAVTLATGLLKRVWVAGDSAIAGTHYARVLVTRSNGELQTFPSNGSSFIWHVYPKLG